MFTVGQKVTGVNSPTIDNLNDFAEMEVIEVDGDDIRVEVIAHEYDPSLVTERFWVSSTDLVGGSYGSASATPSPVVAGDVKNAILLGRI